MQSDQKASAAQRTNSDTALLITSEKRQTVQFRRRVTHSLLHTGMACSTRAFPERRHNMRTATIFDRAHAVLVHSGHDDAEQYMVLGGMPEDLIDRVLYVSQHRGMHRG